MAKKLTSEKARKILHDKSVHGKPLTEKQRKFFGAIAGGAKPYQDGGWLDKYDMPQAQNGIEGTMGGLTDIGFNYNGAWNGPSMQNGGKSTIDSVRHQANKILQYEQLRGGPGGTPLPGYSDPRYMSMLMNQIYPEVKRILPDASAMEAGEAMDFIFNAGWDKANNKITKDPRAYALQEYYRQYDQSKLDQEGKWAGRKNPAYSFDQEYSATIGKLPENERRVLMNKGRDWYYKNINNPAPGTPSSDYYDTWYGRIWNTNDYQPFNPNNPKFIPKKQDGGMLKPPMAGALQAIPLMQMGGSLPGAVGFMYARTQSPAPSNGPYAKKTKASAQDGKKLSYGQWKKQYNLKETPDYNLKRAWELGYTPDKTGHLPTVDNQTGQFLKAKGHPTLQLELDWYNSAEAADFRSKNAIDSSGKFFKYVPKGQNGQEMKYYQEGLDFKPKTISQDGSEIPVDPMGYWNPENVGSPVIIPSNVITMEGVDQPLIGISDTGDVQYMEPGEDYEFDGEYVTEYPVAKGGVSVNNTDAQPLKKLDQLLNFTNYNKPTKGGWLDKYN